MCFCVSVNMWSLGVFLLESPFYLWLAGRARGRAGEELPGLLLLLSAYAGPTCALQTDSDCLACLTLLALWPSWCYAGGLHSWLHPASSRAQPVSRHSRGQTTRPASLSWLDGTSDTTTRLTLFCLTANSVLTDQNTDTC